MKALPLTRGLVTLVDDEDFAWLSESKWHAVPMDHRLPQNGQRWYARRWVRQDGKPCGLYMHRVIMAAQRGTQIDHIDGNGLNNTRVNLRFCTPSQNNANKPMAARNRSGFKGVYFDSNRRGRARWRAEIIKDGKRYRLGLFVTPEEAAEAYSHAAKSLFGEFAFSNDARRHNCNEGPPLSRVASARLRKSRVTLMVRLFL